MTPTTKTDVLIFLKNKKLLAGTIHIRYLIYLKAIYGQKTKEIDFSTLAMKLRFWPNLHSLGVALCEAKTSLAVTLAAFRSKGLRRALINRCCLGWTKNAGKL